MAAARAHTQGKQSHCPLMANASPLRVAGHWGATTSLKDLTASVRKKRTRPRTDRMQNRSLTSQLATHR